MVSKTILVPLPVCTCGPAENSSSHWPSGSWGRVHRHSCSCVILTATTSTQIKIPTELSRLCDCNVRLHYSGPQVILVSCFLFVLWVTYTKSMTAACFFFFISMTRSIWAFHKYIHHSRVPSQLAIPLLCCGVLLYPVISVKICQLLSSLPNTVQKVCKFK